MNFEFDPKKAVANLPAKSSKTVGKRDPLAPRRLDFSKAVRGKYYKQVQEGTKVVLVAPDLLDTFPDSKAVDDALRSLKQIADADAEAGIVVRGPRS